VLGSSRGRLGCILGQKWLGLSRDVDDCKPMPLQREQAAEEHGGGAQHAVQALAPGAYTRPLFSST